MTAADRCPGVLRPHRAEDGIVIRLRVPGGQTTGRQLAAVAGLSARHGNGELQLTTRSSLQLRGLPDPVPDPLIAELVALGFLPSAAHDRVRNVVASPLTGLSAERADLRPMIAELGRRLLADPALAELPGRFLFALDDGTADVTELPFDLGYRAGAAGGDRNHGALLIGSPAHRIPVRAADAPQTLLRLARAFLTARCGVAGRVWHVRDLPDWVAAQAGRQPYVRSGPRVTPLGRVAGAASVQVPLGLLSAPQARVVAELAGAGAVVLTPWRGLVLPGAATALEALEAAGLVTDPRSGWALVSACVGAPHCSRTAVDTRAVARSLVRDGLTDRVHVSGCERRCGAPATAHRELVGAVPEVVR